MSTYRVEQTHGCPHYVCCHLLWAPRAVGHCSSYHPNSRASPESSSNNTENRGNNYYERLGERAQEAEEKEREEEDINSQIEHSQQLEEENLAASKEALLRESETVEQID